MMPAVHLLHPTAIVLAAGRSSRFGEAKLLKPFRGKTLLRHAVDAAKEVVAGQVIVVTGAWRDAVERELADSDVQFIHNDAFSDGMASSIRKGLEVLLSVSPTDGCFILVADQPFVDAALLKRLLLRQESTRLPIVASHYDDVVGTPVLFHRSVFPALMSLQGDKGARALLQEHPDRVATVLFPDGAVDIDTPEDYERLTNPQA
jgi:molybdenum cofactor cytidylyltransferase